MAAHDYMSAPLSAWLARCNDTFQITTGTAQRFTSGKEAISSHFPPHQLYWPSLPILFIYFLHAHTYIHTHILSHLQCCSQTPLPPPPVPTCPRSKLKLSSCLIIYHNKYVRTLLLINSLDRNMSDYPRWAVLALSLAICVHSTRS